MRGDFTRDTRERARRMDTRSVLLEQGRPLLDSDLNEQAGLVAERSEAIARHVIGIRGVPRDDAGFAITSTGAGFTIGTGSLYAEGLPLHNSELVAYDAQLPAGLLPALTSALPDNAEALVYLEAVLRPALDAELAEPALDGVDTAVREVPGWVVRVAPIAGIGMSRAALIEALDRNQPVTLIPWRGTTGGLEADVDTAITDPGPCEIAPTSGYLDQLNRNYRVEIHDGGPEGTATYKWTEDASIEAGLRTSGSGFMIDLSRARTAEGFGPGTIVELIDDASARAGLTGKIGKITSNVGSLLAIDGVSASDLSADIRLRRWAEEPKPVPANRAWAPLAKGVRVRFALGNYVPGAAWSIPARTVLGDISWPPYSPADITETIGPDTFQFYAPSEGRRRHAALALIKRAGTAFTVTTDLRDLFPPLTDITADAVRFDDGKAGLGADDVQEAIELLSTRRGECCTWHVRPSSDLQGMIDAIPTGSNGTLCFAVGNYALPKPLRITGKGHIRLVGVGPGSKLWCRASTQALIIDDCRSLDVSDVLVAAENAGPPPKLGATTGAIEIASTGPVRIQRSTVIVSGRRWRQAAAIRIACSTKDGGGDVTIEDCDIVAGDLSSGIVVLDPRTLRIANNRVRPRDEDPRKTLARWSEDRAIAAAVGRIAFSYAIDKPPTPRVVSSVRRHPKLTPPQSFTFRGFPVDFYASRMINPDAWKLLTEMLPVENPNGNSRDYRLRIRHLVSAILPNRGKATIGGKPFNNFSNFYGYVAKVVTATLDTGIVIGGARANDVSIVGNRIEGAFHGIRAGIGTGIPQAPVKMGTVQVKRNLIRLRVVPADVARTGIFIGNVDKAWVTDNDIATELADPVYASARTTLLAKENLEWLHSEGVRVIGVIGPVLHVRGNSVAGCSASFTVTRRPGSSPQRQWLVQGNFSTGAAAAYRLDPWCTNLNNV